MDLTPSFSQLFSTFWYLIPLALLIAVFKTPWFKGVFGEFQVNLLLKLFLPKDRYHLIKDVTLPTQGGGTTQIDHILVSKQGVFIIETKNMKGWIFGAANQKQWTQKIYKLSSKFQNPLHQNYKHLKTLETALGIDPAALFSVIVFIGAGTLKTEMPENVAYARGCISFIKSKKVELLTEKQVHEIIAAIEGRRLERGFKTNREHVAHVRQIVESKAEERLCPKCGALMMVREAKRGPNAGNRFWGCSAFPRCRAVINLT